METPTDKAIKNIVQNWDIRKIEVSADEKNILDIFNKDRTLGFDILQIIEQTGKSEEFVKPILKNLSEKQFLFLNTTYALNQYEIRNRCIEVYESESEILSKIVKNIKRLEKTFSDVHISLLTKQSDIGKLPICRYYVKKLESQDILKLYNTMNERRYTVEAVKLKSLGKNLADYLYSQNILL